MEMRDLSSSQGLTPAEEQSLNSQATQPLADDALTDNTSDPEAAAEAEMTHAVEQEQKADFENEQETTKESLMQSAKDLLEKDPAEIQRDQISRLRQQFANFRKVEIDNARTQWQEAGNAPEDFKAPEDAAEAEFNDIIAKVREKKNAWAEEQEQKRKENLAAKNEIIDKINTLASDTDNVNRTFDLYRELQAQFNAIGEVPATDETQVWKRFQEARENYSDNLKINKVLRDYDFAKNLDSKNLLIDEAVALDAEPDIIVAFRRLQELHDKWRQIGPVAKELREEIWQRFKDASAVVSKKYQAFFEERKAREAQNEAAKTALCEKIEAIDIASLSSFAAWEKATAEIIEMQNDWRTLGFASRKVNNALFTRFRQRCDEFFTSKAAFFKNIKEEFSENLSKKTALVERAEALKDSTDWKKSTDEFVAMQKEWKAIGAVPRKHSDAIWKRFQTACDYFFEQKKKATSGQRQAEQANLEAKRQIIADIQALAQDGADDVIAALHQLQDKWQQTGHVPFRDKDSINDAYRAAVSAVRKAHNVRENKARMDRFESNVAQLEGDDAKLGRERERLARALENRRMEIRTYENNIGFLSSKSKSGESMVNEFRRKIESLKEDIASIQEKIRIIDSKL